MFAGEETIESIWILDSVETHWRSAMECTASPSSTLGLVDRMGQQAAYN